MSDKITKHIKRINIQNGDIILIPDLQYGQAQQISNILTHKFPFRQFVLLNLPGNVISGIKVINAKGEYKDGEPAKKADPNKLKEV